MCWGYNIRGQLGDGTTNNSLVPVLVNHSTGLRAVSLVTSGLSSCVIFDNGSVGCWGNKYTVFSDNGAPTGNVHLIDLGTNVDAIMLDGIGSHTCAVTDNGSMQCWGVNTHGQLGDGTCSSTVNSDCSAENMFPGEGDPAVHVNLDRHNPKVRHSQSRRDWGSTQPLESLQSHPEIAALASFRSI